MAKYCFSGHESFACKSLWLKKGYDFVVQERDFNAPDAVVYLGVGKNMVSSIRYWLKVCKIYDESGMSQLGNYIFNNQTGKDPYLEDLATLYLLHFNLVFSGQASIYKIFFCDFQRERTRFSKEQLMTHIKYRLADEDLKNIFNENTVKKDIDVLFHNYALPRKPQSNEDFSSLFIDLDLLRITEDGKEYYFNTEGKRKVPKEIFLYALVELKNRDKGNTLPYDDICTQWYQSISYPILDQRLDTPRDEQEDKLVDELIYMFRKCEKNSNISRQMKVTDNSDAYSFDMVTNQGTNIRTQTYILPEKDKKRSSELEDKINRILSGNNNVDVCTPLSILNKKINE